MYDLEIESKAYPSGWGRIRTHTTPAGARNALNGIERRLKRHEPEATTQQQDEGNGVRVLTASYRSGWSQRWRIRPITGEDHNGG